MNPCSDFDSDCNDIEDPLNCWLGHPIRFNIDMMCFVELPVSDGYCPLIRKQQKEKEYGTKSN